MDEGECCQHRQGRDGGDETAQCFEGSHEGEMRWGCEGDEQKECRMGSGSLFNLFHRLELRFWNEMESNFFGLSSKSGWMIAFLSVD
jgi:hypothetical protein